jgi:hypothetical protein
MITAGGQDSEIALVRRDVAAEAAASQPGKVRQRTPTQIGVIEGTQMARHERKLLQRPRTIQPIRDVLHPDQGRIGALLQIETARCAQSQWETFQEARPQDEQLAPPVLGVRLHLATVTPTDYLEDDRPWCATVRICASVG